MYYEDFFPLYKMYNIMRKLRPLQLKHFDITKLQLKSVLEN
jgi:hypothetical protein